MSFNWQYILHVFDSVSCQYSSVTRQPGSPFLQYIKDIVIRLRIKREINLNNESGFNNKSNLNSDLKYKTLIFNTEYNKESIKITTYLTTLKKLKDISALEFRKFKREVLKYGVYKRKL